MRLKAKVEAIVYAAEDPVTVDQIAAVLIEVTDAGAAGAPASSGSEAHEAHDAGDPAEAAQPDTPAEVDANKPASEISERDSQKQRKKSVKDEVRAALEELVAEYARDDRAIEIRSVAGGYRMATKLEHHDVIRAFVKGLKPPMRLSLQALETLAVIAYKQPVTAPEINEIRGVDSSGVLGSLISRKLIATAGRKQVIGRPILYRTSKDFLLRFGLKDLSELPSMEEFEKLALQDGDLFSQETSATAQDNSTQPAAARSDEG